MTPWRVNCRKWGNFGAETETDREMGTGGRLTTGEDMRQPSQSQMGGCVERIPLVSSSFMDFPACRIDLFQSCTIDIYSVFSMNLTYSIYTPLQFPFRLCIETHLVSARLLGTRHTAPCCPGTVAIDTCEIILHCNDACWCYVCKYVDLYIYNRCFNMNELSVGIY